MIGHIFRRDVRRLWPAILLSLGLAASVAWHDRWRSDWLSGGLEGYLNLLLVLVWALLIGLAVEQEPIAGDRQFWLTRPYRRTHLLAAKAAFGLAVVHLPSLLCDAYVLKARGFSPFSYAPQLLAKQALLACALTIPCIGLASLVRSFSQFVLELVGVAAAILLLSGALGGDRAFYANWEPFTSVRRDLVVVCVAVGAAAIVGLQYWARRVAWSRVAGALAAVLTGALYTFLLPHTALAIRTSADPAPVTPSIRIDPAPRPPYRNSSREISLAVPITVEGFPTGTDVALDSVRSEIETASGQIFRDELATTYNAFQAQRYRVYIGRLGPWENMPISILLQIDPKTFATLSSGPVTFRGEAAATISRPGESAWMAVGDARAVPGAGSCYSSVTEDRAAQRIKLECESPVERRVPTRVRLWSPASGREWKAALANGRRYGVDRNLISLSPLYRDQTGWEIAAGPLHPIDTWRIAASEAPSARIEVTPQELLGYATVRYEFRNLDLRRYRAQAQIIPGVVVRTTP